MITKILSIIITISCVQSKALIGDFQFMNEFDTNVFNTYKLEKSIGNFKFSVIPFFTEMCPAVNTNYNWFTDVVIRQHLNTIWNASSVPMMTWQPSCYQPELPTLSNIDGGYKVKDTFIRDIGQGLHDTYLENVALELKLFLSGNDGIYGNDDDRRVYIRLGHEMNGGWYHWSVAFNKYITTNDYKSMWVRTRQVFDSILNSTIVNNVTIAVDQSTRIQFVWNPNNFDAGGVKAEEYYPGDKYVDYFGMDVYNPLNLCYGGQSPIASILMIPMIQRFQALSPNKSIGVPEFGCEYLPENGPSFTGKWYADFFETAKTYGLSMLTQFNYGPNAVFSPTPTANNPNIPMYIEIVRNHSKTWLVQGNPKLKRLISDADFLGSPTKKLHFVNRFKLRYNSSFHSLDDVDGNVDGDNTAPCTFNQPSIKPTRRPSSYPITTLTPSVGLQLKSNDNGNSMSFTQIVGIVTVIVVLCVAIIVLYCAKPQWFSCKKSTDEIIIAEPDRDSLRKSMSEEYNRISQTSRNSRNDNFESPRNSMSSSVNPNSRRNSVNMNMNMNSPKNSSRRNSMNVTSPTATSNYRNSASFDDYNINRMSNLSQNPIASEV